MYNKHIRTMKPSLSMKAGIGGKKEYFANLAVGVPDILCPNEVKALLHSAVDKNLFGYGSSRGSVKGLENLKHLVFSEESEIDPGQHLMLVNGAKYGIYLSLKAICDEGDTIILMQPYWLSYPEIVQSLGVKFISWNPIVDEDGNLEWDLDTLSALLSQHKVKALMLNNPNNPAGKIFDLAWIKKLNDKLLSYNIWLIIDEVYRDLVFDTAQKKHFSIFNKNIIRVGSFSKSLSVPGLRIGYICANPEFINYADTANQHIQTCINSLSAYVIENIDKTIFLEFAEKCSTTYAERYQLIQSVFPQHGLRVLSSASTFYTFVDFGKYFQSGEAVCEFLSNQLGIIAVPGSPYGDQFQTYIRICLTLPVEKLASVFEKIINSMP